MLRTSIFGFVACLAIAGSQPALAQEFGAAEQQAVLHDVANLSTAERNDILTTVLPEQVANLHAEMPMRVDAVTTAIAVTYVPTVVTYSYRTDPGVTFGPEVMNEQRAILVRTMCGQHDTFFILALGVTLRYVYRDAGKGEIGTFDLVLADCGAIPPANEKGRRKGRPSAIR